MKKFFIFLFCCSFFSVAAQTHWVKSGDVKLAVYVMGKGKPIIVLHGGPGLNSSYMRTHFARLAKQNQLIFFDQRACGNSDVPVSDSLHLKNFANDIEAIRRYFKLDKVILLAHSWGVMPALAYATHYKANVAKMIWSNPTPLSHQYDSLLLQKHKQLFSQHDSTDRIIIMASRDFKNKQASGYEKILKWQFRHSFYKPKNLHHLQITLPENFYTASQALALGLREEMKQDFYPKTGNVSVPVLILHGIADMIPLESMVKLHELLPQSTLIFFHRSGHFPFIEEQKKFRDEVAEFLSEKK